MSRNQSKTEVEDTDAWIAEDAAEFGENVAEASAPPRSKLETRHKIEDLIEERRLKRLLDDYESFDLDDERPRRLH